MRFVSLLQKRHTVYEVLVLYHYQNNLWKITDFGLCSDAMSKNAKPTIFARGTPSYRAPELLREEPAFTNKVDI